jgi:hypothetical protein
MAGDSFGRTGDPTQRDFQNAGPYGTTARRLVKALGGDVIPAVGGVAADTIMTVGRQLPKSVQDPIVSGYKAVVESAPAQAISRGTQQLQENYPDAYATANELVNIGTAGIPTKNVVPGFAKAARQRVDDALEAGRKVELKRMLTPDDMSGLTPVQSTGFMRKIEGVPDKRLQGQIDEVAASTDVNPRGSNTEAFTKIESKVDNIRNNLDADLRQAPNIYGSQVSFALDQAKKRAAKIPSLKGTPGEVANSIYDAFDDIVSKRMVNGEINPADLLDARRELDSWLKLNSPSIFGDGISAYTIATREIRDTLNGLVGASAPNAAVADDLSQMHKLLSARDTLLPRAIAEIDTTRLGRYVQNVERRTGLAPPKTPLAVTANVRSPAALTVAGIAPTLLAVKDAFKNFPLRAKARGAAELAAGIRRSADVTQRAALLSLTNKDEEQ